MKTFKPIILVLILIMIGCTWLGQRTLVSGGSNKAGSLEQQYVPYFHDR